MNEFKYLMIGGGITAVNALRGIREKDKNGLIAILTKESFPPYSRPPLSKDLWKGKSTDTIWLPIEDQGTEVFTDHQVIALNLEEKSVTTQNKEEFHYQTLLLAMGTEPKHLRFSDNDIIYYRDYADYLKLKELVEKADKFAVIGAGFIGSEIAAALNLNNKKVTILESGTGIGWRVFPPEIVEYLNDFYQTKGVKVIEGANIRDIKNVDGRHQVLLKNGQPINVDGIISGVGVKPNIQFAEKAGIYVEDGIKVNSYLETSAPGVFAAGDVAAFHSSALDKTLRIEHNDNAKQMGWVAGFNMAGGNQEYDYLPMFYSDLFDIGYEAVGLIDARLDPVIVWKEEFKRGVIYYRKDNIIKGILLWNEWGKIDAAREIIAKQRWIEEKDLKTLL